MCTTKNIFEDFIDPLEENSFSPWLISQEERTTEPASEQHP